MGQSRPQGRSRVIGEGSCSIGARRIRASCELSRRGLSLCRRGWLPVGCGLYLKTSGPMEAPKSYLPRILLRADRQRFSPTIQ